METYKNELIKIIEKIDVDVSFKDSIISFLKTYDGSDSKEFHDFGESIVNILCTLRELKVKSDGYDALKNLRDEFNSSMEDLKQEHDMIMSGEPLPEPVVTTNSIGDAEEDIPDQI
ncbi:hypothetical protein K0B04_01815 [Patescibacteria group bacterium]|nr:hypothetical protein [Patescibacteria group bacterium]